METLVWILQAVPHAIFITGLIVAGHWAMKEIIVIDENNNIKNELPEEYKDIEVKFSRYCKFEFCYENDDI